MVPKTETDIEKIAKLLPACGKLERRIGGNVIACHQGKVIVAAAGPTGVVQLKVMRTALP